MSGFLNAFGAHYQPITSAQRAAVALPPPLPGAQRRLTAHDGGETLNSDDDGPSSDLSSDSTFVDAASDDATPLVRESGSASNRAAAHSQLADSDDDDDDDDDDDIGNRLRERRASNAAVAVHQSRSRAASSASAPSHARSSAPPHVAANARVVSTCPICWDEQPYIADTSKRTAMNDRFADYREVMYRYYNAVRGRQAQETVLRGMLEIRREKIERFLSEYSKTRFTRWTMAMLREHFDPASGHRFDPVLSLEHEIEELDKLKRWTMEHGMWLTHPETGERVFNIRAVDVRLRISREFQKCIQTKAVELERRARSGQAGGESDMIMQALVEHSASTKRRTKRARLDTGAVGDDAAGGGGAAPTNDIDQMYRVGRL